MGLQSSHGTGARSAPWVVCNVGRAVPTPDNPGALGPGLLPSPRHLSQVRDTAPDWAGAESALGTLLRATVSKPALLPGKVQAEVLALSQRNN